MDERENRFGRILRPALLGAILLGGFIGCAKTTVIKPELPKSVAGSVRFSVLAQGAKQVSLVGSFNGWRKDATPMTARDSSGLWSVELPLKAGEYTFMYLIDGMHWVTPPLAEDFVTDGFGQSNGVVIVR